jgi:hypothetical protein
VTTVERATRAVTPFMVGVQGHRRRIKEGVVGVVAFGLLTGAAFTWHEWAGLVAAGLSVLAVDWAVDAAGRETSP